MWKLPYYTLWEDAIDKKLYGKSKQKLFNLVNTVIIMTNKNPKWLFLDSLQEWSMYYVFIQ